jgi:hypothetical protein
VPHGPLALNLLDNAAETMLESSVAKMEAQLEPSMIQIDREI